MADTHVIESKPKIIDVAPKTYLQVAVAGLVLGLFAWVVTLVVSHFIIDPLFCTTDGPNFSVCTQGGVLASNLATIASGLLGLLALVKLGVYRPLLIVIASAIVLWGLGTWIGAMDWYWALIWSGLLYAISYVAFAWLTRIRVFWIALAAVVVLVILTRIISAL